MIVTIHQPLHMPWLGFFNKMLNCDLFILLDDCQFRKNYYFNRNKIRTPNGLEWITVPVVKKGLTHTQIKDVKIAPIRWEEKYTNRIREVYKGAPHYRKVMEWVTGHLAFHKSTAHKDRICALNYEFIDMFMKYLHISCPIVFSHQFGIDAIGSERIAKLVEVVGGGVYLSGPSGRDYLCISDFDSRRIKVVYQEFEHPLYDQLYEPFIPGASALDLLMNHSPDECIEIIGRGYTIS